MSYAFTILLIFGTPALLALLVLTLRARLRAKLVVVVSVVIGLAALVRAIGFESSTAVDRSGFLAWWGSACILASVLAYVARISLRSPAGSQLTLRLFLAFGVTACAFVSGLLFEPLGGMLIR